jgi:hypothetical protein
LSPSASPNATDLAHFVNGVGVAMSLHSQLNHLASSFTHAVFEAIREVSLEELVAETGGLKGMRLDEVRRRVGTAKGAKGANAAATAGASRHGRATRRETGPSRRPSSRRLKRRSSDEIQRALGDIVTLVENRPRGLRAEEIRSALGMQAKEMPRILGEGLATRRLRKRGHKRATTYFAA